MSTRASIIYTNNGTHIYEETTEWDESKMGYNIHWTAFWREYEGVQFIYSNGLPIGISVIANSKNKFNIPIADTYYFESDSEGFGIGILPGTPTAEMLKGSQPNDGDLDNISELNYTLQVLA